MGGGKLLFEFKSHMTIYGLLEEQISIVKELSRDFMEISFVQELTDEIIMKADHIIARASVNEIKSLVSRMKALGKNLDTINILVNDDIFDDIFDGFTNQVGSIWPKDISGNKFRYFFDLFVKKIKTQNEYEDMLEILSKVINATDDLIWVKDVQGRHKMFNDPFLKALPPAKDGHKKTREECTDRGHLFIWELSPEDYKEGEYICMESELDVMNSDKTITLDETLLVGSGELRNLVTRKSPLHNKNGEIVGTIGVAQDVTQELKYKKMLKHMAYHDDLTKLYNRRYLFEFVKEIKTDDFAVIYMDLDNFKDINDEFGHLAGDKALILTAEQIIESFKDDMAFRVGGDEFVVISKKNEENLNATISNFLKKFEASFRKDSKYNKLRISIGYKYKENKIPDIEKLLMDADKKMYEVKKRNKE